MFHLVLFIVFFYQGWLYSPGSQELYCSVNILKKPNNEYKFILSKRLDKKPFLSDLEAERNELKCFEFLLRHEELDPFCNDRYIFCIKILDSFQKDKIFLYLNPLPLELYVGVRQKEFKKEKYNCSKLFYISIFATLTVLSLVIYAFKDSHHFWIVASIYAVVTGLSSLFSFCFKVINYKEGSSILQLPLLIIIFPFCVLLLFIENLILPIYMLFPGTSIFASYDSFDDFYNLSMDSTSGNLASNSLRDRSDCICINVSSAPSSFERSCKDNSAFKVINKNAVEIDLFTMLFTFYSDLAEKINSDICEQIFSFLSEVEIVSLFKINKKNTKDVFYNILDIFFQAKINQTLSADDKREIEEKRDVLFQDISSFYRILKLRP